MHRHWRGKRLGNGMRACDLLYKAAYVYCKANGIRYLYMVVSDIVLKHMRRSGLPCQEIGAPRRMPDGVLAAAVVLDWIRIREVPALVDWYASGWKIPPDNGPSALDCVLPPQLVASFERRPVVEASA